MQISRLLVKVDNAADRVPLASFATNLADIFQKCVIRPILQGLKAEKLLNSHYYVHLKHKSILRCVILLVPGLGNAVILIYDLYRKTKGQRLLKEASKEKINLKQIPELALVVKYRKPAYLGNLEALYRLGQLYDQEPLRGISLPFYRQAAAEGHLGSICRLAQFYENGLGGLSKNPEKAYSLYTEAKDRMCPAALGNWLRMHLVRQKELAAK